MKLLATTTAGIGHLHPLVPLARAALVQGHEVRVAAPASLAPALATRGLPHLPLPDYAPEHVAHVEAVVRRLGPPGPGAEVEMLREVFGWAKTDATLDAMRAAVASWQPDLVLHEAAELSGPLAAEEVGIQHATVAIALRRTVAAWARPMVEGAARVAEARGLPADLDADRVLGVPWLTLVPPGLEVPGSTDDVRMVPHGLTDIHDADHHPVVELAGRDPLVWVSLGTETWHVPGAADRVLPALAATAAARPTVRFLLTVGTPGVDLPTLPANVRVEGYVPQERVLDACQVVLGHGGFNTTLAALAAGRPQVVVPLFSTDQFETAARIDEVGAGVAVDGATPARLGAALDRALTDPTVAAAADSLAGEMAALPTPDEALGALSAAAATT